MTTIVLDEAGVARGRVVVGVQGSDASVRALQYAVGMARDRGWDLEIVTAWPDADDVFVHDVPGRYMVARGRALQAQLDAMASLDPELAERVSAFLVNERPASALVARCADATLLVVGAGRPDRERDRQGVGAECVKAATCPVMVVPTVEAEVAAAPERSKGPHGRGHERARASRAGTAATA